MAGETWVRVQIHGPRGYADVDMIADTDAALTTVPEHVVRAVGLIPAVTVVG
jgi:hypothetical protein